MCIHKAYIVMDIGNNHIPLFPFKINKTKLNCALHDLCALHSNVPHVSQQHWSVVLFQNFHVFKVITHSKPMQCFFF